MPRAPRGRVRLVGNPLCPTDPSHGQLITLGTDQRFWCPNQEHDGRPASHPDGPAPSTPAFFTAEELSSRPEPEQETTDGK